MYNIRVILLYVAILTHLYGTFGRVLQANVTVDLRRRGFRLPVLDIEDSC